MEVEDAAAAGAREPSKPEVELEIEVAAGAVGVD